MQSGYVESLQIQRKRETPFHRVSSIGLEAGKGMKGDCHALGGETQIAFLSSKAKQWIREQESEGLCFLKFKENIVTQGIDYSLLNPGDILIINHAVIEIGAYAKRCFPECILRQNNQPCELQSGARFGKVLKSGKIQVGDRIRQSEIPYLNGKINKNMK